MKLETKTLLLLGMVFLFFLVVWIIINSKKPVNLITPPELPSIATQSAFSKAIEEASKAAEAKKFIATYGPCKNIPILMYHHVGNVSSAGGGWLYVRPEVFASQMDYLISKGYVVITLPEVVAGLQSGGSLPNKSVAITFDDGYRDIFDNAFPVLRARNLRATVFLITQLMEGNEYLTWSQAREMAGSGIITLGDHTLDHQRLASLTEEEIRNEVTASKNIINTNTGVTTNVFAYPFGSTNGTVGKILQENGFVAAVTASRGFCCAKLPYGLSRIRVGNASLNSYGL